MRSIKYISFFLLTLLTVNLSAQQIVNHSVNFQSGLQSMWGEDGVNFSINQTIPLFPEVNWNVPINVDGTVTAPAGFGTFGVDLEGFFEGTIGCEFSLSGFTLGQVEVDYPIDITLDMPSDLTYDQGDDVTILTDYQLAPGYALDTYYPTGGEAALDLYFGLGAELGGRVCLFGCAPFTIIPEFNTGIQNINIFTVNTSEVSFLSLNGGAPLYSYALFPLNTSMIPGDPLGQFGLNGTLDIPYVTTTDNAVGLDLVACGESGYVNLNLDIFALLSNLPIPGASALGYLSGQEDLGCCGAYVYWNFLSASIDVNIYNKQCFNFSPKVYGDFDFPVPVEYQIVDGATGALSTRDTSSLITVEIGDELLYKFPCYFEDLDITPTYWIDGIITNHTYDSIPVDFLFSSLAFGFVIPEIELTPVIVTPELCIGYPCGWFDWCTSCWDPPDIPAITIDVPDFHIGPLIDLSVPITSIEYDWFLDTWSLDGFDSYLKPSFRMSASPLGISNTQTDVLCHGDNTGEIEVTYSALTPALPYTYQWTNGQAIEDISNLLAGPYELSAYDAHGCQLITGATILQPESPLSITPTSTSKSCNGGSDDGEINLLIQGGTFPYSVSWDNGMAGSSISGLAAGSYTATVTDDHGCIRNITVDIDEPNLLGQVGAITNVNCFEGTDGAIEVTTFGGTLPYSYDWNNSAVTEDIDGLTQGTYILTITDARNCTSIQAYDVEEPLAPVSLNISGVDILCNSDSTGSVDLGVSGGTPGYTFEWFNSEGIILPYQSEDLSNIPADNYTGIVTDFNGCEETISIVINEPANGLASTPVLTNINCNGDLTGIVDPSISGGTGSYTYTWSTGSGASIINSIGAGIYTLQVIDDNGCIFNDSYELTEPTALVLTTSGSDVLCNGESTGSATVEANGATPNYTYLWSNGELTPNLTDIPTGNYSVTVTDDLNCSETTTYFVGEPANPLSVSYIPTDVDCYGNSTGAIDMEPAGGTSPYNYVWATSGSVILTDTTEDVSNLPSDTYILTITDFNNCVLNSSVLVDQPAEPLQLSGSTTVVSCYNGSDGTVSIDISGGTIPYLFNWSDGSTTEDLSGTSAGTYNVIVTDANGCTINGSYEVEQPQAPLLTSTEAFDVKCNGGNDGYIISNVGGGVEPYSYLWSTGDTTENIYNLIAGTYSLTVTDAFGCVNFTGGNVYEPDSDMTLSFEVTDVSCFGGNDGLIGLSATGGTAPLYYNWGNQETILMSEESDTLSGLNIGEYILIVTDANGCSIQDTATVNEPPLLESSYETVDVLCNGDSTGVVDVTIWGGTQPYSYSWSNGNTNEDAFDLLAGWYYYEVTDDHGCQLTDSAEIFQPSRIWYNGTTENTSCMDQADGIVMIEVGGGVEPFYFEWSNGETTTEVYNLAAGDYQVIFYDANGCYDTVDYVVYSSLESCIEVPNAFTPDGDNYNDTWFIENLYLYPDAEILVFNKWGNKIYSSQGEYSPWDGTVNGQPLPSEVYYYIISLNNDIGEKFTGTITIVR